MSALTWEARVTDGMLQNDINRVESRIKGMTENVKRDGNELESIMKNIGTGLAAYFSTQFISSFAKEIVDVRGEFQKFKAVLTNTLNGDDVMASKLLAGISDFAAKTPYQLTDITENFIKLANQGVVATQEELTKLGDVAAVTGKPIGQLFEAILDINNPERWKEFGMRVTTEGEKVMLSFRGQKIEFERTVQGAKDAIAQIGSMKGVEGTMKAISGTLIGQISNFEDAWDRMLNNIGKGTEGIASSLITGATGVLENYKMVITTLGGVVATLGAAKAAAVVYTLVMKEQAAVSSIVAASNGFFVESEARVILWKQRHVAIQQVLNKLYLTNPYVLATAAVVGFIASMVILNKKFEESIDAKKRHDARVKETSDNYQKQVSSAKDLIEIIKSETEAEANKVKALESLKKIYPDIFGNLDLHAVKTRDLTAEIKALTNAEYNNMILAEERKQFDLLHEKELLERRIKDTQKIQTYQGSTFGTSGSVINTSGIISDQKRLNEIEKGIELGKQRLKELNENRAKARAAEIEQNKKSIQDRIKEADSIIKLGKLKEDYEAKWKSATNDGDRAKLKADIALIDKAINRMDPKKDKGKSISEQYADELDKVEQRYIEYYNMLRQLGDNFDKSQFESLLKQGEDFKTYLENQRDLYRDNFDKLKVIASKATSSWIDFIPTVTRENEKFDKMKPIGPTPAVDTKTLAEMKGVAVPEAGTTAVDYIKDNYEEILGIVRQITDEMFMQMGLSEETARQMSDMLNSALSGKPLQVASQAISMIIASFPDTAAEKYAKQIEAINKALREQQRLIELASRNGEEELMRRDEIALLKDKLVKEEEALNKAIKAKDNSLLKWGPIYNDIKKKVNELTEAVEQDKIAVAEAEQALKDFLSGGITQNTIADVIAEGFRSGKTSVDDFAGYMNDVLLDAVMQIFKTEILGDEITKLSDYISKSLQDKTLTKEEKEEIDRRAKAISESNKILWDNLTNALNFNGDTSTKQGLSGEIKGITEETGSLIAGQFFAMRELNQKSFMTAQEQLSGINNSVAILGRIEQNTRHNARLNEIADGVSETNKILKEKL